MIQLTWRDDPLVNEKNNWRGEMNPSMFHPSGFLIISLFSTAKPAPAFLRDNCNLPLELYRV